MRQLDDELRPEEMTSSDKEFASSTILLTSAGRFQSLMSIIAGVSLILAACILVFGTYPRREIVKGILEPASGLAHVQAGRSGTIIKTFVREGGRVAFGDPLLEVSSDVALPSREFAGQILDASAKIQRSAASAGYLNRRSGLEKERETLVQRALELSDKVRSLEDDKESVEGRYAIDRQNLESLEGLVGKGFVSQIRYRDYKRQLLSTEQERSALRRETAAARTAVFEVNSQIQRLDSEAGRLAAEHEGALALLRERSVQTAIQNQGIIYAGRTGRLAHFTAKVGASTSAGATLATIVQDDQPLHAVLWVPSRSIGFIRSEQEVRIKLEAFPHEHFGTVSGWVTEVSDAPVGPGDASIPFQTEESHYRVKVRLDRQQMTANGKRWRLPAGSAVVADIVLEHRTFLQWLVEPLVSAREGI